MEMLTIGSRIKFIRDILNLNQTEFGKKLNINHAVSISKYERGDINPSSDFFSNIAKTFHVNLNWLLVGEGDVFQSDAWFEVENLDKYPKWEKIKTGFGKRILDAYKKANKEYLYCLQLDFFSQGEIKAYIEERKIPTNQLLEDVISDTGVSKEFLAGFSSSSDFQYGDIDVANAVEAHESSCLYYVSKGDFVYVPLYKDLYAILDAKGVTAYKEFNARYIAFRKDWLKKCNISNEKLALIHFEDDSMSPTILREDIILIDMTKTQLRPEKIMVIESFGMVYIKRIKSMEGKYLITKSDNPLAGETKIDFSDPSSRIIGEIVWFGRSIC